jgi:hypothetical protein
MADLNALKLQVQDELKTVLPVGAVNSLFSLISTQGYVPLHISNAETLLLDLGTLRSWSSKTLTSRNAPNHSLTSSNMGTKNALVLGGGRNHVKELHRTHVIQGDGAGGYSMYTRYDDDGRMASSPSIYIGNVLTIKHSMNTQKVSGIGRITLADGSVVNFNLDIIASNLGTVLCCPFDDIPESVLMYIARQNTFSAATTVDILLYEIGDNSPIVRPEILSAKQRRERG